MGGGHPDIKMRISFKDFEKIYEDKIIIGDITYDNWHGYLNNNHISWQHLYYYVYYFF